MRTTWSYLMAAVMGVGGLTLTAGCDRNDQSYNNTGTATTRPSDMRAAADRAADRTVDRTDNAVDRTGNAADRAADRTGESARTASGKIAGVIPTSESEAYSVVSEITSAAMTNNGFKDIVERLAKNDRERLGDYAKSANVDDLNSKLAQLTSDWKAKYNHDFEINNSKGDVFKNWIRFSEVKKEGFNTGTLTLPASHGMPDLTFNLESTGLSWKLDIPDSITGEQLKSNLMKQFDMLESDKANWPADMNEGYRVFAHHVLAALAGK
jgi:hypothetical protein